MPVPRFFRIWAFVIVVGGQLFVIAVYIVAAALSHVSDLEGYILKYNRAFQSILKGPFSFEEFEHVTSSITRQTSPGPDRKDR